MERWSYRVIDQTKEKNAAERTRTLFLQAYVYAPCIFIETRDQHFLSGVHSRRNVLTHAKRSPQLVSMT